MTLVSLLKDFPNICLAKEGEQGDNEKILEYYDRSAITTSSEDILYKRGSDFFSFMKEKTDRYLVLLLKDDDNNIQGVATISYRDGYVDGKLTTVGYLGDLRVSLNRKLIRQWRNFYAKLILSSPQMEDTFNCAFYQTALVHDNFQSRNNLANSKIKGLKYVLLEDYHMLNIVGSFKLPFKKCKLRINHPKENEIEQLIEFLDKDHRQRNFGHNFLKEFEFRLKNRDNFSLNDWIVVRSPMNDEILAVTCLWGPVKTKQIIINKIPLSFKLLKYISKIIPFMEIYELPQEGIPLKIKYIHQISFNKTCDDQLRQGIFNELVSFCFQTQKKLNILAYCDYDRESFKAKLKSSIYHSKAMGLYSVHQELGDGTIRHEISHSENAYMPAFDMALV